MKTYVLLEIEHAKPLPTGNLCVTDVVAQRVYDWLIARNVPAGVKVKLLDDVMREAE